MYSNLTKNRCVHALCMEKGKKNGKDLKGYQLFWEKMFANFEFGMEKLFKYDITYYITEVRFLWLFVVELFLPLISYNNH